VITIAGEVVRALAVILNTGIVGLAAWVMIRAGHLPPDGYAVIIGVILLAPVSAVIALLWPRPRTSNG
jgi:hypothetical protein